MTTLKRWIVVFTLITPITPITLAFPPAPHHTVFGTVRDERGHPISVPAKVTLKARGGDIYTGSTSSAIAPGINYSLEVPMDSGTLITLYRPTAMQPNLPFTMVVTIGQTNYLPIEIQAASPTFGEPAQSTRLDLTLGVDADGDGLPDRWENDLLGIDLDDAFDDLSDINPGDDFDHDGISNLTEYLAGTYAFDRQDGLKLEILDMAGDHAHLRFLAITGRAYHLEASSDGRTFARVPFATGAPQNPATTAHVATDVRQLDVYVSAAGTTSQIFRLHVQ